MNIISTFGLAGLVCAFGLAGPAAGQDHTNMPGMDMSGTAGMGSLASTGRSAKVGDLEISGAFAKAMLPGQPVGGGFVTIRNGGSEDRLLSAASPVAGRVELHEMKMQDNVMKMRELKEGITVPAGGTVELSPGGLHLMFMQVKEPFKEGTKVPVTLTFEKAGSVDVEFVVKSARGN